MGDNTNRLKKTNARIVDIAREAKVSASTISRYLNGARVNNESERRIEGYLKDAGLWHLRPESRQDYPSIRHIGMIIPDLSPLFFATHVAGILDAAYENNMLVTLVSAERHHEKERQLMTQLADLGVDALIYTPVAYSPDSHPDELSLFDNIPVVVSNRRSILKNRTHVYIDNISAGYHATKYMLKLGRTNIGFIIGAWELPFDVPTLLDNIDDYSQFGGFTSVDRFRGFLKALREYNVPFSPSLLAITEWSDAGGAKGAAELLGKASSIDGLITTSNILSAAAVDTFKKHGYHIPQDISIISWGDNELAKFLTPSLTSVDLPAYKMGRATIEVVVQLLRGDEIQDVVLDTTIIPRESTTILQSRRP